MFWVILCGAECGVVALNQKLIKIFGFIKGCSLPEHGVGKIICKIKPDGALLDWFCIQVTLCHYVECNWWNKETPRVAGSVTLAMWKLLALNRPGLFITCCAVDCLHIVHEIIHFCPFFNVRG